MYISLDGSICRDYRDAGDAIVQPMRLSSVPASTENPSSSSEAAKLRQENADLTALANSAAKSRDEKTVEVAKLREAVQEFLLSAETIHEDSWEVSAKAINDLAVAISASPAASYNDGVPVTCCCGKHGVLNAEVSPITNQWQFLMEFIPPRNAEPCGSTNRMTHRNRCKQEATRDVIFLFQHRQIKWTGLVPEGYNFDGENVVHKATGLPTSVDQLLKEHGRDYVSESWRVVGVWLDRKEAEAWGDSQSHNYGKKNKEWRVYGTCAEGDLAALLRGDTAPSADRAEVDNLQVGALKNVGNTEAPR